jgi:hypothetical protein
MNIQALIDPELEYTRYGLIDRFNDLEFSQFLIKHTLDVRLTNQSKLLFSGTASVGDANVASISSTFHHVFTQSLFGEVGASVGMGAGVSGKLVKAIGDYW